jgi:hypothetical protein
MMQMGVKIEICPAWPTPGGQETATIARVKAQPSTSVSCFSGKTMRQRGTVAQGSLQYSAPQITTLTGIANQCPATGGNAVFRARAMLETVLDGAEYDDEQLCGQQLVAKNPKLQFTNPSDELTVDMFPNPGKDQLNLSWKPMEGSGQLLFRDQLGRAILARTLDMAQGFAALDMHDVEPGIYFCQINMDGKPTFLGKYVLIK